MNIVRHSTQEVRVWGLNSVLVVGHCAFIVRVENKVLLLTFYIKDLKNMQLGLELHINDEPISNPNGTF